MKKKWKLIIAGGVSVAMLGVGASYFYLNQDDGIDWSGEGFDGKSATSNGWHASNGNVQVVYENGKIMRLVGEGTGVGDGEITGGDGIDDEGVEGGYELGDGITDTYETEDLIEDEAYFVNVTDSGLFYENVSDGNKLYKTSLDGKSSEELVEDGVTDVRVKDGWVYYTNYDDGTYLYKVKENGSRNQLVFDTPVLGNVIHGDDLYYPDWGNEGALTKRALDGSDKPEIISDKNAWRINVVDNYVYYESGEFLGDGGPLYRLDMSTGEEEVIDERAVSHYFLKEDKVYYSLDFYSEEHGLYVWDSETKDVEKLSDESYLGFFESDGYLWMKRYLGWPYEKFDMGSNEFVRG